MAAWMEQPNHHPSVERWAAFEGAPVGDSDPARLGYLRYGDRYRALMTFEVRMNPAKQPEKFQLDLPSCGALLWREPGKAPSQNQTQRPAKDECFQGSGTSPVGLFFPGASDRPAGRIRTGAFPFRQGLRDHPGQRRPSSTTLGELWACLERLRDIV